MPDGQKMSALFEQSWPRQTAMTTSESSRSNGSLAFSSIFEALPRRLSASCDLIAACLAQALWPAIHSDAASSSNKQIYARCRPDRRAAFAGGALTHDFFVLSQLRGCGQVDLKRLSPRQLTIDGRCPPDCWMTP